MIGSEAVRVRQSASSATDPAVLAGFACDPSVTVRASLALNPAAPDAANAMLARDPDIRVRELLARKLGSLLPGLSDRRRENLRQRTWTLLTQLAMDEAERVRAVIAAEVKSLPDAPADLILRLAHDPTVMVSEPVILFSPMLSPSDLVALVAHAPHPSAREAVARRRNLPETVSDAIAGSADDDAIRALLANQSAQIREATLDALVARSADHDSWHDPLTRRPLLSERAMRMLSDIVAGHLLEVLAERVDLPDELRDRVRLMLHGSPPVAPTSSPEDRLLAAERAGDVPAAISLLAERANVSVDLVRQAVVLRSTKGLVALTWKAGLSMRVAVAMQALLAKIPPSGVIQPGPDDGFPLTADEMTWQLTFLAGAVQSDQRDQIVADGVPRRTGAVEELALATSVPVAPSVGAGVGGRADPASNAPGQAWFGGGAGSRPAAR